MSPALRSCTALLVLMLLPLYATAESLDERVGRLERLLENRVVLDLMDQLQSMQQELQELRSLSEEQAHQLESLEKRQRDLYLDLDRRLARAEREGVESRTPAAITELPSTPGDSLVTAGAMTVEVAEPSQPLTSTPLSADGMAPSSPAPTEAAEAQPEPMSQEQLLKERQAYQMAFNQLRELRYQQASKAFRQFIEEFPHGRYAHIAQYWLGEASYAQRDFKQAIIDYQKLIKNYASSPKIAEAMLKIGYSRFELKQYAKAEKGLQQLLQAHPGTTESSQAQQLLQQISKATN